MSSSDSSDDIVDRIRQGDESALAIFLQDRREALLGTIARKMSDALRAKVDPDDILQEVSVSAFDSLKKIDWTDRDPFSWLCQLADRKIIDAHRFHVAAEKRSSQREVSLQKSSGSGEGELIDLLVQSMTSPSAAFSKNQKGMRLQLAIQSLSDDCREAIRLRYVEEWPTKQIAEQMGRTDAAIRVLLTRTLKKLEAALSDDTWFRDTRQ